MNIQRGSRNISINGSTTRSIIEFEFKNYILYVFPGTLSEFDILIKYKKGTKKIRTPKHIHWVVDILLKMQHNNHLTRCFLEAIKNIWNTSSPLNNRDYETNDIELLEIEQYNELNNYGEYPVDFLFVLMKLLVVQEKSNRNDAYMFGQIIDELLELDLDIFKIISKAGFGGR